MASGIYDSFFQQSVNGNIDWDSDTIKIALVTSSYVVDLVNHDYFDDITNEVSSSGYTAGGATLSNASISTASNVITLDADNIVWNTVTFNARAAIVYKDTGTDSTSPLMFYYDFVTDRSPSGANFTINVNSLGFLTLGSA